MVTGAVIVAVPEAHLLLAMEDGSTPPVDLAIPVFGYPNHISLDRGFGFIRKWSATDAAAYEGRRLRDGLLDKTNTASSVVNRDPQSALKVGQTGE